MKKITVDVAVAGAGVAGVTSAVSAGEKGYSVALFEINDGFGAALPVQEPGGPPVFTVNGIFAVETEFQNSRHHVTKKKDVYDYLLEHAHWNLDPRIVADFVNRSNEVYEWLVKGGLKAEVAISYFKDAPFTWLFFDKNAPRLPEILGGRFKALANCTLYSNVDINGIWQNGTLWELKGTDANNEPVEVSAKAVVITSGEPGFSMGPPGSANKPPTDLLKLAEAAGAYRCGDVLTGMAGLDGSMMPDELGNLRQPTQLFVNKDAERFTNEEVTKYLDDTALNFANQQDGIVYTIFDESVNQYHEEHGWFYFFYGRGPQRPENTRGIFEKCIAEGTKSLFIADSIEELAVKLGLDQAKLKQTIAEYNDICVSGRDPLMKDIRFLIPLTTPPFYAARMKSNVTRVAGPLRPSSRCEVLDKHLKPIPGLFAAGGACNIINGELYTHRVAGSRSTYALVSGRIIGESVPEYLKKNF